jgi:hypothetical protein
VQDVKVDAAVAEALRPKLAHHEWDLLHITS